MNGDLRIGTWLVQPGLNTISQHGTTKQLEPKVMEVLVCLAHHPGETLPKEQLLQSVWPDTFVSDDVLVRSISELRGAFEDDVRESKFIQTIHKRGYRLIALVEPVNGIAGDGSRTAADTKGSLFSKRSLRLGTVIGVVATVALLTLLALTPADVWRRLTGKPEIPQIRSIAVLPLQNLSGDPTQEYFADAMTEELITELCRLSSLRVISRTSVMRYRNSNQPLPEIARELGVEGIIEGSILRSGDKVRITAQLIYAPQDRNIWAQSYERDLRDVLALQSTVASSIVNGIRVQMTPVEQTQLHSSRPVNLKAHEAYLQGRYHLQLAQYAVFKKDKGRLTSVESEEAQQFFRRAIKEDPNYAPYYLGLWEASSAGALTPAASIPESRTIVLKALKLDDGLAEAHRALANILSADLDFRGAESEFLKAIELAPSNSDAHCDYAAFIVDMGRAQEAMKEFELSQSLDPKNDHMAEAFFFTRQFDRAIPLYLSRAQSAPGDFYPHFQLANMYSLLGRQREAIQEWQEMATLLEYKEMAEAIGRAYDSGGYHNALRVFTKHLEASSERAYIPEFFIASIYGFLGDKDRAFFHLERAYQAKDGVSGLEEPEYDPLRNDPRFADLLRRVGLPVQ
jgi:TolB-like protein/DNA-binding winged helix-turn-helix (wHTH) protein/tetratricopeptide (TPR) repeat protein